MWLRHHVQNLTTMNKLRTHIVIHESFLLYFIPKIVAMLEEAKAPCFMKNTSGSSKSQMLPSMLPLPASFFKVLPLRQKFNRFQLPFPHPCLWLFHLQERYHLHFYCLTPESLWRDILGSLFLSLTSGPDLEA